MREEGYYWVKFADMGDNPEWMIMEWCESLCEFILNGEYGFADDELIEIDERRITRHE